MAVGVTSTCAAASCAKGRRECPLGQDWGASRHRKHGCASRTNGRPPHKSHYPFRILRARGGAGRGGGGRPASEAMPRRRRRPDQGLVATWDKSSHRARLVEKHHRPRADRVDPGPRETRHRARGDACGARARACVRVSVCTNECAPPRHAVGHPIRDASGDGKKQRDGRETKERVRRTRQSSETLRDGTAPRAGRRDMRRGVARARRPGRAWTFAVPAATPAAGRGSRPGARRLVNVDAVRGRRPCPDWHVIRALRRMPRQAVRPSRAAFDEGAGRPLASSKRNTSTRRLPRQHRRGRAAAAGGTRARGRHGRETSQAPIRRRARADARRGGPGVPSSPFRVRRPGNE